MEAEYASEGVEIRGLQLSAKHQDTPTHVQAQVGSINMSYINHTCLQVFVLNPINTEIQHILSCAWEAKSKRIVTG